MIRATPARLSLCAALSGVLAVPACGPGGEDADPTPVDVRVMESPAAEGSEEPYLSTSEDGVLMSWIEPEAEGEGHLVRFARYDGRAWSAPSTVARGERFFVNWADFPSINEIGGTLVAHWLRRGPEGGYDYGVRVAVSTDGGATWSDPWTPHEDGTPTEHGFVSVFAAGETAGLVWLDGRRFAEGPGGDPPTREMTLRFRTLGHGGPPGPETLVDERVCDCCQTDAALTSRGPVVVYRDRSPEEVRDIRLARLEPEGWTPGTLVHADGWEIASCPVNGPAVAARDRTVAAAWFTAAGDEARVRLAFSSDAGDTFDEPLTVDDGAPVGRVDVVLAADGSAVVSWLERTGEGAEVRLRRLAADGSTTASAVVAPTSAERAGGFPRMVPLPGEGLLLAWTDVHGEGSRVRVARIDLPSW